MIDFKDRGVLFCGRNDNKEEAPTVYAIGNKFYNNTITNCAAYNTENGIYGRGCLNIGGQTGMLIYNNTITQNSRREGYNGWPIKYYNGGYLNDCKIYSNKLIKIPMNNNPGVSGWDFAIELFNASGLDIYDNTIQGSIDLNYQKKGIYSYSIWIHNNIISQPKLNIFIETGITLEFGTNAVLIENNTFKNIGIPFYFTPREGDAISNIVIKNNACENIGVMGKNHQGYAVMVGNEGGGTYSINNFFVAKKFIYR